MFSTLFQAWAINFMLKQTLEVLQSKNQLRQNEAKAIFIFFSPKGKAKSQLFSFQYSLYSSLQMKIQKNPPNSDFQ